MLYWIKNTLYVKANVKVQKDILNAISSDKSYFDFNALKPIPSALNLEFCALGELGLAILEKNNEFLQSYLMSHRAELQLNNIPELVHYVHNKMPQAIELGKRYQQNIATYQAATWYDWCRKEWGVKWNASQVSIHASEEVLEITFETPWADPEPILRTLSTKFPDLLFECVSVQKNDPLTVINRVYSAGHCLDCAGG